MTEIRVVLDQGAEVLASRFFQVGQALLATLDTLSDTPSDWLISELSMSSAVAAIRPRDDAGERPMLRLIEGLNAVAHGDGIPGDWNPDAVSESHDLVESARGGAPDQSCTVALVRADRTSVVVALDAYLAGRLTVLQPPSRVIHSELRGQVTGINVNRGNRASLRLRSGRIVRVGFPDALREPMRDALFETIDLAGTIKQDANGLPFHVSAESLALVPAAPMKWVDLIGYDPDITGGLPAREYLRRLRGDD